MPSIFLDFGIVSLLLVVAHLLRASWGVLQHCYIPSPIIAGGLGLLLSPQAIEQLPSGWPWAGIHSPWATEADGKLLLDAYPNFLIAVLFGTLFMGARTREASPQAIGRRAADTLFYNLATLFAQYGLALLIGALLLQPLYPELNRAFALMLPGGFAGGYGTVTAISTTPELLDWTEIKSVGYTFATIGLVSAIVGGMALINVATRRGWTRLIQSVHELPEGMRRGFLPAADRPILGQETVSPIALDPLGWHVALVLSVVILSVGVQMGFRHIRFGNYTLPDPPLFALAVIVGGMVQKLLDWVRIGQFVDRRIIGRIGSMASDYLIVCGIASIKLYVVTKYAVPIALMSAFGMVFSIAMLWWVGRRVFHNFWFERSLFVYGWNTGVFATSIILLRVVDPRLRTKTLADFGISYMLIAPLEIVLIVALPMLVGKGVIVLPAVVLVALAAGCVLLSRLTVGWFNALPSVHRAGEAEVIAEVEAP